MGLYSSAYLIWGIPVLAYEEDNYDEARGELATTKFWRGDDYGWREFDRELEIVGYGHYEDPDNERGILTSTRMEKFDADCWEAIKIPSNLPDEMIYDKVYSKANDAAREYELDVDFYSEAGWWLIASYG